MGKKKSKASTVKVAVMSDLHCHASTELHWDSVLHSDGLKTPKNHHPVEALKLLIERSDLSSNVIVAPGDLTNKVNKQGLLSGWSFVKSVGKALGCTMAVATVGNHDVDSQGLHDEGVFGIAKRVGDDFPVPSGTAWDQFWARGFCFLDSSDIRVLVVNSVLQHHDEPKAKRGEWAVEQVEALKDSLAARKPHPLEIAVVHHHPVSHPDLGFTDDQLMVRGDLLVEALADAGFAMIIHGHKHHARLRYLNRGVAKLIVFASGSFAAIDHKGMLASDTRYLFHIVEFCPHLDGAPSSESGLVHSWDWHASKGWRPSTMSSADFPHLCGFGCVNPIDEIASAIAAQVGDQDRVFWDSIQPEMPQLSFLTPDDFSAVAACLATEYGLDLSPEPPDLPIMIGRKYTGGSS